jgi:hypothetical protein
LDYLVDIYDCVDGVDWTARASCRDTVTSSQRGFVSEVQFRLDPNRRDRTYHQLVERYEDLEEFVEGW